ncbi:MAG: hypothetical protein MUC42_12595 [Bryobacter sp.]|jgi:hypothetical protein|nr:hypothetical protein [Bryobacter sp.]
MKATLVLVWLVLFLAVAEVEIQPNGWMDIRLAGMSQGMELDLGELWHRGIAKLGGRSLAA